MDELEQTVLKYGLQNAIMHRGKADNGAVIGKVLAERKDLRSKAKEISEMIRRIISEINEMTLEVQEKKLTELAPELLVKKTKRKEFDLPKLENVQNGVIMRFAPNPSGPLHIGHSRVAILNDEYVRRYGGSFINRFEDTDPNRIDPDAYDLIKDDLGWLEISVHETVYQSDRFDIYYRIARELLENGHAYICECDLNEWRRLKKNRKPCPHRNATQEDQFHLWDKMFDGTFEPRQASLIIKTDLNHTNPALRDFVALRIEDHPHPRTGTKYRIYPLMNFSVAIDDHLMGLTHVLRGKDHLNNSYRQMYIFDYLSWPKPEYIHYGRVRIIGPELKTSAMLDGIRKRIYTGWDDPQLGTLASLSRRGIRPGALRKYWKRAGISEVDVEFSWDTLFSFNRERIDPEAKRYFFVDKPVPLNIVGADLIKGRAPLHPDREDLGYREYSLAKPIHVYVSLDDIEGTSNIRLKDLCNVRIVGATAEYMGNELSAVKKGFKIIHWVPEDSLPMTVIMPDGIRAEGYGEKYLAKEVGKVVQLERFGFAMIESANGGITAIFSHK